MTVHNKSFLFKFALFVFSFLLANTTFTLETAEATDLRSWDRKIDDASRRFKVLPKFNNEAVLDKETQLVWEQTPIDAQMNWFAARVFCTQRKVGGRLGWRLPFIHELASLFDDSNKNPALPTGHPFGSLGSIPYWTESTVRISGAAPTVWTVTFDQTVLQFGPILARLKGFSYSAWCVRSGIPATTAQPLL